VTLTSPPLLPEARLEAGRRFPGLTRLGGGPLFWVALVVLGVVVLTAVLAPLVAPRDPLEVDLSAALAGPSPAHLLGADQSGRDVLSRLVYGSRTSLLGPLGVIVLSTVLGTALGLVAAWRGGWTDSFLSRSVELIFSFPGLLLAILVIAVVGPGLLAPVAAMAVAYTPAVARLVRGAALQEKARPYVAAYQVQGFSGLTIALRHLLPNIAPVVLAQSTISFGYAVMDLAALSYLGFGVQPPSPDWGATISQEQPAVLQGVLLPALAPGVLIVLVVVAFNVLGEGIADRVARRTG
jgi:peptide/nickel transport system permease protein